MCECIYVTCSEEVNLWRRGSSGPRRKRGGERLLMGRGFLRVGAVPWNEAEMIADESCECTRYHSIVHLKVVEVVNFMLFVSYHTHTHTQAGFGRTLLVCVTETRFRWTVR